MKKTMRNLLALAIMGCLLLGGPCLAVADQKSDGTPVEQAAEASIQISGYNPTDIDILLLKNAVSALWGKGDISEPGREVNFDALSAPEHVFVELLDYAPGNKSCEIGGMVRRMAPRNDGIEVIAAKELFHIRFHKVAEENFYIDELKFEPLPNQE